MKIDTSQLTALRVEHNNAAKRPTERKRGDWYNIRPSNGDSTTVYMYAEIGGFFGVTASEFVAELSSISTPKIDLHINSLGGEIFEGTAIMAAISDHPAYVTGIVDGVAASAASFILMACDQIVMRPDAMLMIHDGQGITAGDEAAHVASASILGKLSNVIAGIYARRAGGEVDEWRAKMLAESWFTASEALDAKLIDSIGDDGSDDDEPDEMRAQYDMSVFRNYAPKTSGEKISEPPASVTVTPVTDEPIEEAPMAVYDTRAFRMALLAAELTGA